MELFVIIKQKWVNIANLRLVFVERQSCKVDPGLASGNLAGK